MNIKVTAFLLTTSSFSSCNTAYFKSLHQEPQLIDPLTESILEVTEHLDELSATVGSGSQPLYKELQLRYEMDLYVRTSYTQTPVQRNFNDSQTEAFQNAVVPLFAKVDRSNTARMKELLKDEGGWLTISKYGREIDDIAWTLVQHADLDRLFQKEVLGMLAPHAMTKETNPAHYAYLHDRVAVADHIPQVYGTQGRCTGPGTWEPDTVLGTFVDVDKRRSEVGLKPLAEYKRELRDICRRSEG